MPSEIAEIEVKLPNGFGDALADIAKEYLSATTNHPQGFNSPHEGVSVIREEFEELWDEVKLRVRDKARMREEAMQLGAMALRFMVDLCQ